MDQRETGFILEIDCSQFKNRKTFSWRRSKRFMYGSLLIFSFDDFKSFGTCIVRKADKEKMDRSMERFGTCNIFVEVVNSEYSLLENFKYFKDSELVLLESKCFFEAFSHTLETLKEMKKLPFESIIKGNPWFDLNRPNFLFETRRVLMTDTYFDDDYGDLVTEESYENKIEMKLKNGIKVDNYIQK